MKERPHVVDPARPALERTGLGALCDRYGQESALLWVVFMDADGACWTVPNHEVRMVFNSTIGRRKPEAGPERNLSAVPAASADAPEFAPTRLRPTMAKLP